MSEGLSNPPYLTLTGYTTGAGAASIATSTAKVLGTTTNDNATAGDVGELARSVSPGTTATITVTIASPGVVTWTAHGFVGNAAVNFTTNGALPTGLVAGTTYYTIGSTVAANTFQLATTVANAIAGTAINTSGTQSGTHTGVANAILASSTAKTVVGVSLTAGDWDIWGNAQFTGASGTTVTYNIADLSLITDNAPAATPDSISSQFIGGVLTPYASLSGVIGPTLSVGPMRVSLSGTTTYFLTVQSSFGVSTSAANGVIVARRRR